MSYLIMECHMGYAIALDSEGRFIKVANLNYEIGQIVCSVVVMKNPVKSNNLLYYRSIAAISVAVCMCIVALCIWQTLFISYGFIQIRINPEIKMSVNRMDYVVQLEGLNEDGQLLIKSYAYQWKKTEQVTDELADIAIKKGYLAQNGFIYLQVESKHEKWKISTEERLLSELRHHVNKSVTITADEAEATEKKEPELPKKPVNLYMPHYTEKKSPESVDTSPQNEYTVNDKNEEKDESDNDGSDDDSDDDDSDDDDSDNDDS
ncbi:MAG: hypothetical protein PHS74_05630 [Lachnospiraceae bacterium]|nr:hypothetical protein [Lachnospiraceae bacterium]